MLTDKQSEILSKSVEQLKALKLLTGVFHETKIWNFKDSLHYKNGQKEPE